MRPLREFVSRSFVDVRHDEEQPNALIYSVKVARSDSRLRAYRLPNGAAPNIHLGLGCADAQAASIPSGQYRDPEELYYRLSNCFDIVTRRRNIPARTGVSPSPPVARQLNELDIDVLRSVKKCKSVSNP